MAIETVYTCDVCGRKKEATNHWWSIWADDAGVTIYPGLDNASERKHACGEQHAHQLIADGIKQLQQETK